MKTISLSVHSSGNNKYRFGISVRDSANYFKVRGKNVVLRFNETLLFSVTLCGTYVYDEENENLKLKNSNETNNKYLKTREYYNNGV